MHLFSRRIALCCVVATCDVPNTTALAAHASILSGCSPNGELYAPCHLACAAGYNATGSPDYPCTPVPGGAAYAGGSLVCTPIICPALAPHGQGMRVVSGCGPGGAYGATCVMGCDDGYVAGDGLAGGTVCCGACVRT